MTATGKFTIADLPVESLFDGALRRTAIRGDDSMVAFNWLTPGHPAIPEHSHPFDQLAFVLTGRMEMHVENTRYELNAGDVLTIPAGVLHTGRVAGTETVLNVDVFGVVRTDFAHLISWQPRPDVRHPHNP